MNILVTNDDGIESPGIWALAEAMSRVGEVLVVAPKKQQSGVGSAVSLKSGINIDEAPASVPGVLAYSVDGTPSDCVIVGLRRLSKGKRFDLLVSGINLGANMGRDILCSGTVMATLQGYFRGLPSIAVSLDLRDKTRTPCFDAAAATAEHLAKAIQTGNMPMDAILNANIPDIPIKRIKGVVLTRAALTGYVNLAAIWRDGDDSKSANSNRSDRIPLIDDGSDIHAVNAGMISVTPLKPEITDLSGMAALSAPIVKMNSDLLH